MEGQPQSPEFSNKPETFHPRYIIMNLDHFRDDVVLQEKYIFK